MSKITLEQAKHFNNNTHQSVPRLVTVSQLENQDDRTLAFGRTGAEAGGRVEVKHVYLRGGAFHVFSYFIGPDDRFLYSEKFSATTLEASKLHIPYGVEYLSVDSVFLDLMAKVGFAPWLIPLKIWDQRVKILSGQYYGHVPEVTCKPHPDSLKF